MSRSLNPYIAGNPVGNSNAFTGRADIVREVLHIFSRPEENAIVLYGQRRIGKTSVLQFLKKTLAQETATGHYFPVYFDLQDKATFSLGDVLKDLANTIANELGFPAPQLGDNPEHSFQYEWLPEQLAKLAKGAALVLLLDEFDVLAAESAKGAGADFFPYLRKLIASDRQRLNFVFVIGRNVSDLNTIALSLFKSVPTRRISLLGKEDTFELIRLAEKISPLRWQADALERIWQLTNGHAFFTQQLCSFAWEEAYDDGDFTSEEISADIVDSVIDDALSASRNAFEWLWDGLPPAERVVSAALAQAGGRSVTETELEKLLHESGVRIVIRELQDAPKLLQDWDLLEPIEGGFRFRVELLRRWIAENKPLRRVQDELDRIEPVAESLFQAAQGLYRNSQLESAENLLKQAIGLNPNHVKANKLLADLLLASGNYVDAKTLLASLYEYQPTEARSRLIQAWMGIVSKANTDDDKLACYEEIFRLDANHAEAKKAYKAIWKLKGDYALEQGLTADALEAYKKAGQDKIVAQLEQEIRESEAKKQLDVLESLKQDKKYTEAFELIKNLETNFPELLDWNNEKQRIEQLITITVNYQQALDALKLGNKKQAQELLVKVICVDAEFEEAAGYLYLAVTGNDFRLLVNNLNNEKQKPINSEPKEKKPEQVQPLKPPKRAWYKQLGNLSLFALALFFFLIFIPAYQDYIVRAKVTEGLSLAASAKTVVAENAANGEPFDKGWIAPNATENVTSISINPTNGEITITYTEKIAPSGSNTLILSPYDGINHNSLEGTATYSKRPESPVRWDCNSADRDASIYYGSKGTISGKYVHANCRD